MVINVGILVTDISYLGHSEEIVNYRGSTVE